MIKLLLLMLLSFNVYAAEVTLPTTYQNGSTVTASNLNGNFTAITAQMNGGLDNDNANTVSGYRLFETKSSLPTNGNQGRVVYLTTNNTLNFDNGSSWQSAIAPTGILGTGKIPYYSSGWALLDPGSQYYSLVSNGTSSLPTYQQVSLVNGVTDNLPVANLNSGTGATSSTAWLGNGTWGNQSFSNVSGAYASGSYQIAGPGAWTQFTGVGTFTKYSEVYVPRSGTLTVKFTIGNTNGAGALTHGRIYRNGVAVGTDQTATNTFTTFSENISGWSAGDLCQLYAYMDSGGGIIGYAGELKLFENSPVSQSFSSGGTINSPGGASITSGSGAPANNQGAQGDIYLRLDGAASTTLYVKTGTTTWTAK